MNIEEIRSYSLQKPGTTEEFPFGPDALVFKVMGKMYALAGLEATPLSLSLKCNPARAVNLREEFEDKITGAYHMNKKHWNSILPEVLPPALVIELIDHSYELVVNGLPKKKQAELKNSDL
ncbi:hypothetical protein GCM10007103_25500 [Salinimicrobium marinum]|uniref:MmcQ-like protein n=1 Tax=Salinimicrobium marinum TaxID=680283 RepID=A0A918SHN4_9FLAO|nr:MmcQ/YjbR family DNA-binding protein [Salinimicrobium marinum]GHA43149.1 hypothetical protein GCM10007103_25500 [Salinimicrobium marinum]